jgi:hypothetical protein
MADLTFIKVVGFVGTVRREGSYAFQVVTEQTILIIIGNSMRD